MLKTSISKQGNIHVTKSDRKRYTLKERRDVHILVLCKFLLRQRLSAGDRNEVKLILSQLVDDWRRPLVVELNVLVRKYQLAKNVKNLDI